MSIRLWKYYWHLILILSLIILVLWIQNPAKSYSTACGSEGCEAIPLSFTQSYVPQEISLVSKPYLLLINPNETENR